MEKSGLIDLRRTKARNYDKFYLTRNPFPAIGIPEETLFITADREDVIKRFKNVIRELLDVGESVITVMVGEYGSGKSHLLRLFKKSVDAQLLSSEATLAVYVKSPGDDFSFFFHEFTDNIGLDMLAQLSCRFIEESLKTNKDLLKHIFDERARSRFLASECTFLQTLEKLRFFDLVNDLKKSAFRGIDSDLAQVFLSFANPEMSPHAWKWLLGEHFDRDEKELLSVSNEIDPKNAYASFCDFVKSLKIVGIKNLVVLVDELEKITLLTKTKKDEYQDDLRRLIDDNPKNMCFYFAIAPRQWQELTKIPSALVRRLRGNWYLLEDFKEDETRELIERYLFSARFDQYPAKKIESSFPSCKPSLFPFTEQAVELIIKESKGVVSDILLICRKALEILCDSEEHEVVVPQLVQLAIGQKG